MSTMLAAEDNTEVAQEIVTDSVSDAVPDGETISDDNESIVDEVIADDENAGDEVIADDENVGDEVNADDENAADEVNADDMIADDEVDPVDEQNVGIEVMSAPDVAEAGDTEVQENTDAPVVEITYDGKSSCYALGGTIDYIYVNNKGKSFVCSAKQNNQNIAFLYYLDYANKVTDPAKEEVQLEKVKWSSWSENYAMTLGLGDEQNYVLYVKAEKDGQTTYARSGGVVVDTTAPKIAGVKDGNTYPAGTAFKVEETNLDVVRINGSPVTPEPDGSYRVRTEGADCVIVAVDKAGNSSTCSITVSGAHPEEDPTENTVISENKVYTLKAGVKYHLAKGNWKVDGDTSVYQGDSDFYVKGDGDYKFSK